MKLDLKFNESAQKLDLNFGQYQDLSDGGFERGYEAGYAKGNTDGYTKGHTDGFDEGLATGITQNENNIVSLINRTITEFETEQNVTVIPVMMFSDCRKLTRVKIDSAVSIKNTAFQLCEALTYVRFPNCETIDASAFNFARKLEVADFPKLTSLNGAQIFGYCGKLKALIIRTETEVCKLTATNTFFQTPIASGSGFIYVPDNLVEQYKAATNWSAYAAQIKPLSELEV